MKNESEIEKETETNIKKYVARMNLIKEEIDLSTALIQATLELMRALEFIAQNVEGKVLMHTMAGILSRCPQFNNEVKRQQRQ